MPELIVGMNTSPRLFLQLYPEKISTVSRNLILASHDFGGTAMVSLPRCKYPEAMSNRFFPTQ